MERSSGIVTADSTVAASAPLYALVTITCGGARFGNCATGSEGIEIAPPSTMTIAQTLANIGRLMKKSTNTQKLQLIFFDAIQKCGAASFLMGIGQYRSRGRIFDRLFHRHAIREELKSSNNQMVAGLQSI